MKDLTWPRDKYVIDAEHEKITGWPTMAETYAYDKGREDEESVIIDWIKKWQFTENSALGKILMHKCVDYAIMRLK